MLDTRPLIERQADAWMNRAREIARHAPLFARDPCPLCGVRGELGCRHTRKAD